MTKKYVRGPLDADFERGYVPMDAPPGIEEREYAKWKAAGGTVIAPQWTQGFLTPERLNKLMRDAGHAINANDGRCGLIEDVLCQTTSLCCAVSADLEVRKELEVAARKLWDLRDSQDGKALHDAWRDLGVALAHQEGRRHISEG